MRVFGIDPGSTATGFAVVQKNGGRFQLLSAGVIRTSSKDPIPDRLKTIYQGLSAQLTVSNVDCVAIESIFRHRSSESAIRLGQARGVALLAAAQHDRQVFEYNAMTVKKTVGVTVPSRQAGSGENRCSTTGCRPSTGVGRIGCRRHCHYALDAQSVPADAYFTEGALMIALLRGSVAQRNLDRAVIDVNGVGYLVLLPTNVAQEIGEGEEVLLHICTTVREDAITLFGFLSPEDRRHSKCFVK